MTVVSNDPIWWPFINAGLIASYFVGSWGVCHMTTLMIQLTLVAVLQLLALLW
jgi:hypothetical protein